MNIAMIMAAGIGSRLGDEVPKQFIEVLGKPVFVYTCELYQQNDRIDAIEIVCHADWIGYCKKKVDQYGLTKVRWIIPGGSTFQQSNRIGARHLESLHCDPEDVVLIHAGVAPFTSQRVLDAVFEMTKERGNAVSAQPCYHMYAAKETDSTTTHHLERGEYFQYVSPLGFKLGYMLDLFRRADEHGYPKDHEPYITVLVTDLGDQLHYTYGESSNLKITTREDLLLFEGYRMAKNAMEHRIDKV